MPAVNEAIIESLTIIISGFNDRGLFPEAPGREGGELRAKWETNHRKSFTP
jgi:hypothetical protein